MIASAAMLTKSDILLLAMVVTESLTLCGKVYRRAACTSLWEAASCLASCTLIVAFCLHTASYDDAVREVGAIGEPSCGLLFVCTRVRARWHCACKLDCSAHVATTMTILGPAGRHRCKVAGLR